MANQSPQGSIQGLCSSAATIFALGMAFLGYWGFTNNEPWQRADVIVLFPALIGFLCLALVPWIITRPVKDDHTSNVEQARKVFIWGVVVLWIAIGASVFL